MDPCKACTIKRDGKHLLGAGTAGSLARKYGLRSRILEPFHVNGSERAFSSGVPLETESAVASRAPRPTPGCGCGDNERPGWTARTRLSPADSDPAFEARGLREEPRVGLGLQ
ncbi:unnamed protein product [Rangifer tarandus platyrhynchus]|uniref:Uncharacterized protein n=2 Tax=Rangifer tarandus platyrhynchus TaxID=3082113 RepID=A0ABN8ZLN5_RANTA|nr:unnamed protein product [Rangifer tarandus platyrhynchus]CAI9706882.1 unnamed protein product [Rangifer tarandus platyrhynchus]